MLRSVGLFGALLVVVIAATPVGAPVQLSYVYSDSMEPAIGENDGYLLVPAGDLQRGDIVTFRSPVRDAHVTHRIVGETERGFLTKGDNNPTTDQASGYPPVRREQVRGEVLTVSGEPVVVPSLGVVLHALRGNGAGLVALLLGAVGYAWASKGADRPHRELTRVREVAIPLFLVAALAAVGVLAYGGPSHELTYVAVESAATSNPSTIPVGSAEPVSFVVNQSASPFTTRIVSVDGANVTNTTRTAANLSVAGTVPPPTDTGPVRVTVRVTQYPSVLPTATLQRLAAWHPLAAATVTVSAVFAPVWLLYAALFDGAALIPRSRRRLWRILTAGFG